MNFPSSRSGAGGGGNGQLTIVVGAVGASFVISVNLPSWDILVLGGPGYCSGLGKASMSSKAVGSNMG